MALAYCFRNSFRSSLLQLMLLAMLSSSCCISSFEWNVTKDYDLGISVLRKLRGGDLLDQSSYTKETIGHENDDREASDSMDKNKDNFGKSKERIPAFGRTVKTRIRNLKKSQIIQSLNDKIKNIEKPSLFLFGPGNEDGFSFSFQKLDAKNMAKGVMARLKDESTKIWSFISGPVASAVISQLCQPHNNKPLTTTAVFILAFMGSSLGFHSFLYFVSIGFGLAVALITTTALIAFNKLSKDPIPSLSNVHTSLALLWALRLMIFLLHREYVNWPDWHLKIYEVNKRAQLGAKFYVWSTVGPFYAMLTLPCIYRLQQAASDSTATPWGVVGVAGIVMQFIGLLVETIADVQKAKFKSRKIEIITNNQQNSTNEPDAQQSQSSLGSNEDDNSPVDNNTYISDNRYNWCDEGLWSFSTHPNYLGELLFWMGTYVGGIASYERPSQWILTTIGLVFIASVLKDACDTLGAKHLRNYGQNMKFMNFRRTHNILGPFPGRSSSIL